MTNAFIAMPFAQKYYPIYKAIREACEQLGVNTIRIDEVWARDDIYKQIEEEILKSEFVIADFSGDQVLEIPNPNVVHEAAFARTKKKYLILMAQDHKCLPFDWRTRPAIIYQNTDDGLSYLKERLVMAIEALMQKEDFGHDTMPEATAPQQVYAMPGYPHPGYPPPMPMYQHHPMSAPMTHPYPNVSVNPQQQTANANTVDVALREKESIAFMVSDKLTKLPRGFFSKKDVVTCKTDGSEMVRITATQFMMGSDQEDDQQPVHQIGLSEYLIDKYLVTNEQYEKFIAAGGYQYQGFWTEAGWKWKCDNEICLPEFWHDNNLKNPKKPVVGVSWYEASAYAIWAGKHLPTEAQWELAARGTDQRMYPWGNQSPTSELANYRGVSTSTTVVDKFSAGISPFGCYDMSGNVWEWCYDWYHEDYYKHSPETNPAGPLKGDEKVCRGGAWTYDVDTLEVTYRFSGGADLRDRGFGFRCAKIL